MSTICECPICMESIDDDVNRVITHCGHVFHCSCLMTNVANNKYQNGFKCPYCRSEMASEKSTNIVSDSDSDSNYEPVSLIDWNASLAPQGVNIEFLQELSENHQERIAENHMLTSFRMFHQRITDSEVEDTPDDWRSKAIEDEYYVKNRIGTTNYISASEMATKLSDHGVQYIDLVKVLLLANHHNWGTRYSEYHATNTEVLKKMLELVLERDTDTEIRSLAYGADEEYDSDL